MSLTRNTYLPALSVPAVHAEPSRTESSRAMAAVEAALAEAAGRVAAEGRQVDSVLIADAERHMRLSRSWLARLNAASAPVVVDTAHALVGPRAFTVLSACQCAVMLDTGAWLVQAAQVTSVHGLPVHGRDRACTGDCRDSWLVSVQDAAAPVEVFSAGDRVHRGALVRANSDSVDVATLQGVVTLMQVHVTAIHVVA